MEKLAMSLANWRAYRERLKKDVLDTEARLNQSGLFDQVNKALLSSGAFLFVSDGGWCALEPISEGGIKYVNILFAKSYRPGLLVRHNAFVEKISREIGSQYLTAYTKSNRSANAYKHFGFELVSIEDGLHFLKKNL